MGFFFFFLFFFFLFSFFFFFFLFSFVFFLLFLSFVFCLLSFVFCLLSFVFCLLSFVFRLISRSPRYLLTCQYKRLSTVFTPHLWTLPCRRSHTVLFLRTLLRSRALAQLPRFLLTCLFRLLYAVLYYTILPHNYRSRSSLLDVSSRMVLLLVIGTK